MRKRIRLMLFSLLLTIGVMGICPKKAMAYEYLDVNEVIASNPEIRELARTLDHDVDKIYQYVHDKIDFIPYMGFVKGAPRTLLDRSGNDADQAALMVALLKVSGYQAQIVYGSMDMPSKAQYDTEGVGNIADWACIGSIIAHTLSENGMKYEYVEEGNNAILRMKRYWVRVNVDGSSKDYDPGFKQYEHFEPITDLKTAIDMDVDAFITAALEGSELVTAIEYNGNSYDIEPAGVKDVNTENVEEELGTYAENLIDLFEGDLNDNDLDDILGHDEIIPFDTAEPAEGLFFAHTVEEVFEYIPKTTNHCWKFTVQAPQSGNNFYFNFWTPELVNKRLAIRASDVGRIRTYQNDIASRSIELADYEIYDYNKVRIIPHTSTAVILELKAPNNLFSVKKTTSLALALGYTYIMSVAFRDNGSSDLLNQRQKIIDQYLANGLDENDIPVNMEYLNLMGIRYYQYCQLLNRIIERIDGVGIPEVGTIGIAGYKGGFYVDMDFKYSELRKQGGNADFNRASRSALIFGSAMEHAVVQQCQGKEFPAASTANVIDLANSNGDTIYTVTKDNWIYVSKEMVCWNRDQYDRIEEGVVENDQTIILPDNGTQQFNAGEHWRGGTYYAFNYKDTENLRYTFGGAFINFYNGGVARIQSSLSSFAVFGSTTLAWEYGNVMASQHSVPFSVNTVPSSYHSLAGSSWTPSFSENYAAGTQVSGNGHWVSLEPVDMVTGGYLVNHTDIKLKGDGPWGLELVRDYDSMQRNTKGPFGPGWTHNYDIKLNERSNYDIFLGLGSKIDAVPLLSALLASSEMMHDVIVDETIRTVPETYKMVIASIAARWFTDQMLESCVHVREGTVTREYAKMPNGTYKGRPGETRTLVKDDNGFIEETREGIRTYFTTNGIALRKEDLDGNTLLYRYDDSGRLTNVSDCVGRYLTFNYDHPDLTNFVTSISDSSSPKRTLIYEYETTNLVAFTDTENNRWSYIYEFNDGTNTHYIKELRDPDGDMMIQNFYNELGQVTNQISPEGYSWNFYFEPFLSIEEDPEGGRKIYHYDDKKRGIAIVDAEGRRNEIVYDANNLVVKNIDPMGHETSYEYDNNCNVEVEATALATNYYFYDENNLKIREVDPRGYETKYAYDSERHLVAVTNALNEVIENYYYDNGKLGTNRVYLAFDKSDWIDTIMQYNEHGYPESIIAEDAGTNTMTYDDPGNVLTVTDANGHTLTSTYDSMGHVTSVTDPLDNTITNIYNKRGLLVKTEDTLGRQTLYTYTPSDDIETVTAPNGGVSRTYYDSRYFVTNVTDALGHSVTMTYDKSGKKLTETDALGRTMRYSYDANGNIVTITDPMGNVVSNRYDELNRPVEVVDALGQSSKVYYDAGGLVVSNVNKAGIATHMRYDELGRAVETELPYDIVEKTFYDMVGNVAYIENAIGEITRFGYDRAGRVVATTNYLDGEAIVSAVQYDWVGNVTNQIDALGRNTVMEYDALNRPVKTTYPDTRITSEITYDKVGNIIGMRNPRGFWTTMGYDEMNQLIATTNVLDETITLVSTRTYDAIGQVVSETDAEGRTSRIIYDAAGQVLKAISPDGSSAKVEYDILGRPVATIDPLGHRVETSYDKLGRVVSTRQIIPGGDDIVVEQTYDALDQVIWSRDPEGRETTFEYDLIGRMTNTTYPNGTHVQNIYDALGRVTATMSPNGIRQEQEYDDLGRETISRIVRTDGSELVTQTIYDKVGNPTVVIDPMNRQRTFYYDQMNRVHTAENPDGTKKTFEYDLNGNQIAITDENEHRVTFGYDSLDRLVATTNTVDGTEYVTSTEYDGVGNAVAMTDEAGYTTRTVYDSMDRPVKIQHPLGMVETFHYDALGQRTAFVNANNERMDFGYDAAGRLIHKQDAAGTDDAYTYDKVGNMLSHTDGKGDITTFQYDTMYQLTDVMYETDNTSVQYTYDIDGNLTRMTDSVGATEYAYDDLGRLLTVRDPHGYEVGYAYDDAGNQTHVRYPGTDRIVRYDYDSRDRLTNVVDWVTPEKSTVYQYDAVGNMTNMIYPNGIHAAIAHDERGYITSMHHTTTDDQGAVTSLMKRDLVRGPRGFTMQETSLQDTLPEPVFEEMAYTPGDRLDEVCTEDPCTTPKTVVHDANGNMEESNYGAFTATFDQKNRTTSITTDATTCQYYYNGNGDRVRRDENGLRCDFLLDYSAPLANVLMEKEEGQPAVFYIWGNGLISQVTADN